MFKTVKQYDRNVTKIATGIPQIVNHKSAIDMKIRAIKPGYFNIIPDPQPLLIPTSKQTRRICAAVLKSLFADRN